MNPAPAAAPLQDPSAGASKKAASWLAAQTRDWLSTEGERWLFVAKAMLAAFGALWLAFRLGLDSPATAMTTTVILALPSSGMVLEKAFYRLLGTVVGCASALLMVALFPQAPPLLFLALALWVALCTSGAAMYRNQQSYSFVLAGYTACMIAIPAIDQPSAVFTLAVTRVTEVGLGVLCAAVVHDIVFPRHHTQQVMRTVQARYERFVGFCRQVLEQRLTPAEVELSHLKFAADIAALESGRAAAFFEAAHARSHSRQLHAFNAAFMTVLTTFYTLHRLIHRQRSGPASARAQQIDLDTAAELRERFARDMQDFTVQYQALAQDGRREPSDPGAYSPRTPPAIVLASGVRAAVTLLVAAGIWYWLAWPFSANLILMATIFCALASSSPRPTAMVKQVLIGFLIAMPLAFACEFLLVARAGDFAPLVIAALPLFALGSYLSTGSRWAGVGIGISMFCATMLIPSNLMHYDVESFLSSELSLTIGVAAAWAMFAVLLPEHTMGQKDHVAAALRNEALRACTAPLYRLKRRFDNRVRDLLNQLNAAAGPAPDEAARAVLRQGLMVLELGHAAIEMRQLIAASQAGPVRAALQQTVRQLAASLRAPSPAASEAALQAILQAGLSVRAALADAAPERRQRLHTALTDLHAMYTSLLDQMPVPSPTQQGEPGHAA